ncbi:MAG: hypothetical protein D6770_03280 [Anaerolineae bacterium]|nr:MAG: hypothetical protein D6770_03280 [Anaerolineae bacterium]
MKHISDFTLNEYLDEALPPAARREVETHLSACPTCQERLDDLRFVFATLERLPELPLQHDLAPAILAHLPSRQATPSFTLLQASQWGLVIGVALWFGTSLARIVQIPTIPAFSFFIPSLIPQLALHPPMPPTFQLPPSFIPLLIASFLLWLFGNRVFLAESGQKIIEKNTTS